MNTGSWSGDRRSFPRKTARHIKTRDGECQLRISPHCTGQPDEADHIIGWAEAAALGWAIEDIDDPANGQAVCLACHKIKTHAEKTRGAQRARRQRSRTRPPQPHPGLTTPTTNPPASH